MLPNLGEWQRMLDTSMRQVYARIKVSLSLVSIPCEGKCCTNTFIGASQWINWDGLMHIHYIFMKARDGRKFNSSLTFLSILSHKKTETRLAMLPKSRVRNTRVKANEDKRRGRVACKAIAKGWQMSRAKVSVIAACTITISVNQEHTVYSQNSSCMSYSTAKLCMRLHDFDPRVDSSEHSATTCHDPEHHKHSEVSSPPLHRIATTSHVLWTVAGGTNGHTLIPWMSDSSHFSNLHKQFCKWHRMRDVMHVVWCGECVVM